MSNDWQGPPGQPPGQPGWGAPQHPQQSGQQPTIQAGGAPGQQWYQGGQPAPAGPPPKKGGIAKIAVAVAVIAGLATGGTLFYLNRSSDPEPIADETTYVIMETQATATEPVFEPRDSRGSDPFYPLETQLVDFVEESMGDDAETSGAQAGSGGDDDGGGGDTPEISPDDFDIETLEADVKTGLYGGTEENTCDPERLIAFLVANPEIGQAWAEVQGITFAELPGYIRSLEVRVLAEPVAVLNHGYDSATGMAYEIDAVLDAGTAVLVDANGDIRTRCYCGNPIKPKPPTGPKPPACLLVPHLVWAQPGGSERRNAPYGTVFRTGRVAEAGTEDLYGDLVEIMWGDGADQMGWTRPANLVENRYCRPPQEHPKCVVPDGEAPVYRTPTATDPIGAFWNGSQSGFDTGLRARILPVGDGARTVVNGRVLVHFWDPYLPIHSGWVEQVLLTEAPLVDCVPPVECYETGAPRTIAGGGQIPGEGPGPRRIEITGRIALEPGAPLEPDAIGEAFLMEIRLVDSGLRPAWVPLGEIRFPVPGQPGASCEDRPIVLCKRKGSLADIGFWGSHGDMIVRDPSTTGEAANAAADGAALRNLATAIAGDVPVQLIGSMTPTNGKVQVRVAGTGPVGWVDVELLDGRHCVPVEYCAQIIAPMFRDFPDQGGQVPGTPMSGFEDIRRWDVLGITGGEGGIFPDTAFLGLFEVGGQAGWVNRLDALIPYGRCDSPPPPPPPTCPDVARSTGPDITPPYDCCVFGPTGPTHVVFTGRSRAATGDLQTQLSLTEYEVRDANGVHFWVLDFNLILTASLVENPCGPTTTTGGCPESAGGPTVIDVADPNTCCVAVEVDGEVSFVQVTLTGDMAELGEDTLFAVVDGDPVAADRFVAGSFCAEEPDCPDGLQLDDGSCEPVTAECEDGEELIDGECEPACPEGEERQSDGSCEPPPPDCPTGQTLVNGQCRCPQGQELLADGTCRTPPTTNPCGPDQERLADGSCRDRQPTCPEGLTLVGGECRCPEGQELQDDDTCATPEPTCPSGQYFVGDGLCCPNGTERIPNTDQCEVRCEENFVPGTDGVCRCPFGQLTLVGGTCCPSNLEPWEAQCLEPCPNDGQRDDLGRCLLGVCPTGQIRNPNTGECETADCPPGQVFNPSTGDCQIGGGGGNCPSGVIDANGDCCASGEAVASDGGCCPTFYPNNIGWVLNPATNACVPTFCTDTSQTFDISIYQCV